MRSYVHTDDNRARMRWLIIGPSLLIIIAMFLQLYLNAHRALREVPVAISQIIPSNGERDAIISPEIAFIMERREKLHLKEAQMADLTRLNDDWKVDIKGTSDETREAADEFVRFMESSGKKASMQEIQSHAAMVSDLSKKVSDTRFICWERAREILSDKQQKEIDKDLSSSSQVDNFGTRK